MTRHHSPVLSAPGAATVRGRLPLPRAARPGPKLRGRSPVGSDVFVNTPA